MNNETTFSKKSHISFAHPDVEENCVCYILPTGWRDFFMVVYEYPLEEKIERYTRMEIFDTFGVPRELFDKVFIKQVKAQKENNVGEWAIE